MITKKIINYRELIYKSTEGFIGRQWVRDAVDDFLKANGPRYFLLIGEPGSGKTAFMADLVKRRGYPHHFIGKGSQIGLTTSLDWRNPIRFAESIGYQLIRDYGGWIMNWEEWGISVNQEVKELRGMLMGAKVESFKGAPRPIDKPKLTVKQEVEQFGQAAQIVGVYIEKFIMDVEQIVYQLLTVPLQTIAERWPEHQVVIIVDGLDEAEGYSDPSRNISKMLPNGSLPANIRFLFSSRPGEHLTYEFLSQAQVFWLSEDEQRNRNPYLIEDANSYILKLAEEKPVKEMLSRRGIEPVTFAEQVARASQGNFLYLYHYAQGVRNGDKTLLNTEALPEGLCGIYEDFLCKIKEKREDVSWDGAYKPVLGTLAVARESLKRHQISDFSGVEQGTVGTILVRLKQFLYIVGERGDKDYAIYHSSFSEYLVSEENEDYIDSRNAHSKIADALFSQSKEDRYKMNYLLAHLIEAHRWEDIRKLLSDIKYLKKKQEPVQQWRFQQDIMALLMNKEIPSDTLVGILEEVLKAITDQIEDLKEKTDWLDTFGYWISEFGARGDPERITLLKEQARKFGSICGIISTELVEKYEEKSDYKWAMRFAELATWVYQHLNCHKKCIEACRRAEDLCKFVTEDKVYGHLLKAEFIRMRARALTQLASGQKEEVNRQMCDEEAREAYENLKKEFSLDGQNIWIPDVDEWKILDDYDSEELLETRSTIGKIKGGRFKAQVVSNKHDAISAMFVIQYLERKGGEVKWIYSPKFKSNDFAPENTRFTILIGGPKAPGISEVAYKFYKANKDKFLCLYSSTKFEPTVIELKEGNTFCYMVGGPSKANTLEGSTHELKEILERRIENLKN